MFSLLRKFPQTKEFFTFQNFQKICFFSSVIEKNYTFPTKHNIELKVKRKKDMSHKIGL